MAKMLKLISVGFLVLASNFVAVAHAVNISTERLANIAFYPSTDYTGEVVSQDATVVSAQVNAVVTALNVMPGDQVKKGEVISVQDCADYEDNLVINQAAIAEIKANLNLTQIQIKRQKALEKKQLTAQNRLDELIANKRVLDAKIISQQAQAAVINREIQRCITRAPYDAVVTAKNVGTGQWLTTGMPIYDIKRLDGVEIRARIPINKASEAQLKSVGWQSKKGNHGELKLLRVSPSVDPQSAMQTVWFTAPTNSLIGEQGILKVKEPKRHIPSRYIERRNSKLGVFINQDGIAEFKAFKHAQMGRPAQVPADWNTDWLVITEGQSRVKHGDRL